MSLRLVLLALLLCGVGVGWAAETDLTRFEARHLHALALTPDGTRLLVVNSPTATLSVFAVPADPDGAPQLLAEIPVGLEPVTVRARTNDEAWVVNELSDSVSIVDLKRGVVVETLPADDEPADVVFAAGRAYVSCARNNLLRVFEAATRVPQPPLPLAGLFPRALATSPDGGKVYAAFFHSGNRTTTLPAALAPAPPAATNLALPPAPQTGLLVAATDARLPYRVLDHDVAEIDTATGQVSRYLEGVGTNLYDVAVSPDGQRLWVAHTEALNLLRFEPMLRGHFQDSRLSQVDLASGQSLPFDLNTGLNYQVLPNPAARVSALAQPTAVVPSPSGTSVWLAAEGSDQLAEVSAEGALLQRIDLRRGVPAGEIGTEQMRGPRSLALDAPGQRLFVFNKLSATICVVGLVKGEILSEFPIGRPDPTPERLQLGRKFFADARLAGNGTAACTACHPDADQDGIAWDLGDPTAEMVFSQGKNIGRKKLETRALHPLKGPMVTQTLRGLVGTGDLHWRADRKDIQSFNVSFDRLQGGERLPPEKMDLIAEYLRSLRLSPNPHRMLADTLPPTLGEGNPSRGRALFAQAKGNCAECHALPLTSNNNIDAHKEVGAKQPLKTPTLRTVYQRVFFDGQAGHDSLSGYGLGHDGTGYELPIAHPYVLDSLSEPQDFRDVAAFVLCVDTGTPPAVGHSLTFSAERRPEGAPLEELSTLEEQATKGAVDLIVRGVWQGAEAEWLFEKTRARYQAADGSARERTREELLSGLQRGDAITFLATLPGKAADFLRPPRPVVRK